MNNREFLNECHDYIEKEYSAFLEHKKVLSELLCVFSDICQKNEIDYFACFGSLLGAIRDGGEIPWDCDCDVCVRLDDMPRLFECLRTNLGEDYFFESNFTDKEYFDYQTRIGKKGHNLVFEHLDIFYVIGAPNDCSISEFRQKGLKLYRLRGSKSYYNSNKPMLESKKKFLFKKLEFNVCHPFLSIKKIDKKIRKINRQYPLQDSENICVVSDGYWKLKKDMVYPTKLFDLSGIQIRIPNDPIGCLKALYKNYQEYLPIKRRFNEFYNYMMRFESLSETNESYRNHNEIG